MFFKINNFSLWLSEDEYHNHHENHLKLDIDASLSHFQFKLIWCKIKTHKAGKESQNTH